MEDLDSDAFMRELHATESSVPWRSHTGGRVHLYLDQFGSFHEEPDTVGAILTAVQRGVKSSLRVVNLLDEESDEEAPSVLAKVQPKRVVEHPPSSCLKRSHPQRRMMTGRGEGGSHWRIPGC